MAEEKKQKTAKKKSISVKPKKTSAKKAKKNSPEPEVKSTPLRLKFPVGKTKQPKQPKAPKPPKAPVDIAVKQTRSLIMFIASVILVAIIFIPGDMVWLWLHNGVRGVFSMLSLFWALMLMFLAVATMLDNQIPKLWRRTAFGAGTVVALNALIYIFTFEGELSISDAFTKGIIYKGGGALGFIFGAPFVKLFGSIPAKILIVLVVVTLIVFTFDLSVKKLYSNVMDRISEFVADIVDKLKKRNAYKHPVKIADDAYFDSDENYEEYDFNAENDDDFFDKTEEVEDRIPQSPVFSDKSDDDFFGDIVEEDIKEKSDEILDEDENDDFDEEAEVDLVKMFEPVKKAVDRKPSKQKSKTEDSSKSVLLDKDPLDEMDADELFDTLLEGDFADIIEEPDNRPEASRIADEITASKKNPVKKTPEQKQLDPQFVPLEPAPKKKLRNRNTYPYPPVELLAEEKKSKSNSEAELKENARKLIETLESFSVGAKIVGYCRGPSITRYEIQPSPGVKISKITNLSDDIALNLAADAVRMEAPIPGKPAIGIEIPNKHITSVTMRELIDSSEFRNHKSKLACVLGRDVAGKIIISDLAKMPHLLIAGTTGSGKSVCVNSILMSILFRSSSEEVKMILIDPKLVEFTKYKGIPHLLIPVVSDAKKAAGALNWAVNEMEERYKEFSLYNVKDIDSYNKMVAKNLETMTEEELAAEPEKGEVVNGELIPPKARKKMPKIVIAIDELADLMMVAPGEVEESICRLAQKARAAGMHLVIATQRPSVNVITGVIKANIPSRISLKVASYVDSKTILDMGGGEKLIGRGDMLYYPVGAPKPLRVQGGFSSDDEIEAVTDFIKNHSSSEYDDEIYQEIERIAEESINTKGKGKDNDDDDIDKSDPMLEEAIKIVSQAGQASTSLLQRKLKVGYARAGRLVDTMEQMGIVGPHEGSKSRKVLLTYEQWLEREVTGG